MPLVVNLRHLETADVKLRGELPVEELALEVRDELIHADRTLRYELEIQQMESSLLVQGRLRLTLQCECVRCLKPFKYQLELNPWTRLLPLEGEEKVLVSNDCIDLTPLVREDILLEFPQHPLCGTNCLGLPKTTIGKAGKTSGPKKTAPKSSAWAELDKLKF